MTLAACADLVRRGDPDRFRAAMAAPVEARARLFPLYAFNLEIARAPWASNDPIVARMRLQFWRDVLLEIDEGEPARAHEVVKPLAEVMRTGGLTGEMLDRMVVARWADVDRAPFTTAEALDAYLADTGGTLMWASAQALGAQYSREPAVRAVGKAAGLAAMLVAAPELTRRGWRVLPETGLAEMIAAARADIAEARKINFKLSIPALRAGWRADGILARAMAAPAAIEAGGLEGSEFSRRARLGWKSLTGGW
ncbi:MAG: squalene/phytoene synthase family protein [Maritimibacter sp.]|nr:squalene/phytoene synthase family protein [Maritimibacter sp.]